jgi:hypothetical protein
MSAQLTTTALDERDSAILAARIEAFDRVNGPRDGDYVRFADGIERRISFVTPIEWLPECDSIQTSDGGSWYLGNGYVSFSGGLYRGVKRETLTLTEETKPGSVWFFHHDYHTAHNGIDTTISFRVYECSEPATN